MSTTSLLRVVIFKFKNYLSQYFHTKNDYGKLKYFLDIDVVSSREEIVLSQCKYALRIITETGLLGSNPSTVPIELNHKLALAMGNYFPVRYPIGD